MTLAALYKHPWFITMWSSKSFKLDFVVGYEDVSVDAWLYSDHQRYFFFQQLSTVSPGLGCRASGGCHRERKRAGRTARWLVLVPGPRAVMAECRSWHQLALGSAAP